MPPNPLVVMGTVWILIAGLTLLAISIEKNEYFCERLKKRPKSHLLQILRFKWLRVMLVSGSIVALMLVWSGFAIFVLL